MNVPPALFLGLAAVALATGATAGRERQGGGSGQSLTLERVARHPPPGARGPTSFRFSHDGRFLYFLGIEGDGAARSLFREVVASGARQVLARPAVSGRPDLSREEILLRERKRTQDTGITDYVLAAKADVVAFAQDGAVWLARPDRDPVRLTGGPGIPIDPQLAPDGMRLAFARDGELYVVDLATGAEKRLTHGAREGVTHGVAEFIAQEEMDRPSGFWWSPDGGRLAYTEVDESGIPVYPIVHQGQAAWEVESERYPFAGGPNAVVRLGVVAATGGETRWLTLAAPREEVYLARVAWDPDGTLLVQVEPRDQKSLRLLRIDPATGNVTRLLEDRAATWINLHEDLHVLPDGRLLWSSEATGFRHLELYRRDGRLIRRLTSGDWAVDRIEGVDEARGLIYFTAAKAGPLERRVYRVGLDGGAVSEVTPEPGFHVAVISPTGDLFVDLHDSAAQPPRASLRDRDGRSVRALDANDDEEVRALDLRPPEFVTVRAADGAILHGALYRPPPGGTERRHPAIVRVYGGPTAQEVMNSWEMTRDLRAQYLARHGYVVFRLDNRGTPRRGVAFGSALNRHLGSIEIDDQVAGARFLAGLPDVDGSRIGVYGWSYGGYVALLCMLRASDVFRAAVAGAPVTDWDGYDTHYTERYLGTPRDNPEGYRAGSVLPAAGSLAGDLLIIHGMADENVHFRHTARLVNALNAAGRKYDLLIFPDERHLPRGEDDRLTLERRIVDHFDRALAAPRSDQDRKREGPRPGGTRPR